MRTRSCISCRTSDDKSVFLRIVKSCDGRIMIDEKQKADGRGAYICKNGKCIDAAEKKNLLSRALKTAVDKSIYEEIRAYCNE